MKFSNKNLIANWWQAVDKPIIYAILMIMSISVIMVATASPAVAERIGVEPYYFIKRQFVFLILAIFIVFIISLCNALTIKRIAFVGFLFCVCSLVLVLGLGTEIKGARRWISIFGFSFQPSEFIKPFFIVVTGWILSRKAYISSFPAYKISILCYLSVVCLLILQPDFGMVITISAVWGSQLFLAGLPIIWMVLIFAFSIVGLASCYFLLPHVTVRVNSFLNPSTTENYQVKKSLAAFSNGGIYGKGPGEGTVKQYLPDSHTDFIFAVIGEELGAIACLMVILLFSFVVIRGLLKIAHENDLFTAYAVTGLLMQFGLQAVINVGVTLHILPTKGMTLPFISYGGSSMMAISLSVGIILALTKKNFKLVKKINISEILS